ncbi:hypothetical protein C7445_10738 [Alicyclobacillus sacchari]|uniref:Uncharacterized protein n=1 Tax=Alicyclobacillus sacchari TaxID=392010 RepID=A0A4R8LNZ7_9BACL|nr:trigger factor [Alicyclobacillus sacchari]TDY46264.1 hypothetical protein C7445_10738 [Alicyclobacillus sacchari]GMA57244.1 hypothetical protein GCM10025858_17470 [Alicyclobacillus sacchari]
MSRMSEVMRQVRDFYRGRGDVRCFPERWVVSYLNTLYFAKRSDELDWAWGDLEALMMYLERTGIDDLAELPWWEYSLALEWIESHIIDGERFHLTLDNARRMMSRWSDFYEYLGKIDVEIDASVLNEAYRKVCGGKDLQLIERIPYTGDELWMELASPGTDEATPFQICDYWMIIMYDRLGRSWDALDETLQSVPSVREKRRRFLALRHKLRLAGCEDSPERLVIGQFDERDIEDAERWVYRRRVKAPARQA